MDNKATANVANLPTQSNSLSFLLILTLKTIYALGLNLLHISMVKMVADELKTLAKLDIAAESIAVIMSPLMTTGIRWMINNGYA
jgi:hypothetical protein